jgi:hypothetical protein
MNTAIRVLLVAVVGMFTCDFRRALLPGSNISGSLESEVVGLQAPGVE